jgi:acetoin utilization protein AcuB
MFVVYSPEGQNFVGAAQNLPLLKVDRPHKVNRVNKSELNPLNTDESREPPSSEKANNSALKAYEQTSKSFQEKIVYARQLMSQPVVTIQSNAQVERKCMDVDAKETN